jgi:hypothetical protein
MDFDLFTEEGGYPVSDGIVKMENILLKFIPSLDYLKEYLTEKYCQE